MPDSKQTTIDDVLNKYGESEHLRLLNRFNRQQMSIEFPDELSFKEALATIKQLVREQAIGNDEPMKDGEDTNQLIAAGNQRLRQRNRLRAEQLANLDKLFGGSDE